MNSGKLKTLLPDGVFPGTFVSRESGGIITGNGITFCPDGNLYISAFFNSGVMRYKGTNGEFVDLIETIDSSIDIEFRPQGDLMVSERVSGVSAVRRCNIRTGEYISDLVSTGGRRNNFSRQRSNISTSSHT
jgi:hypothetical protein